ncbi:hypothetical protein BN946_scf184746.g15 [Trametes cinnabarina]|uniref:Nitrate reductase [NADPH] n=1 Tax=Pycnoporus cinnabarinus TaxID=5643 RepID=A0A060SAP3_PYCCI|nr:hypothetical protein BN946_scf184746.g15 [Trametes cinnabarina]
MATTILPYAPISSRPTLVPYRTKPHMPAWTKETFSPPWPRKHPVQLAQPPTYESAHRLGGSDDLRRHTPGGYADPDGGEHGRRAGMYGMRHTEDGDYQHSGDIEKLPEVEGGIGDDGLGWEEKLHRTDTFASIRDVKKDATNFKLRHPRNHAFARYVLPVAESEIKEQNWPGQKTAVDDSLPSSVSTSSTSCGLDSTDDNANNGSKQDEVQGNTEETTGLTDEQQKFLDKLLVEMATVESFKNNPGHPKGELQLLDEEALEQLESRLSIDDQNTPDSWIPRSSELLRLTGKHPMNAEPNLLRLFEAGMVTPTKYLNFEGADEPSEGPYATSIPLMHAMNPSNDIMLVFGMNGRVLHPDHGYPLRTILPGYVGGRQVKWLKKLWITKEPNRSHYHIWDNRVVPSFIDSRDHPYASAFFHHESTACWEHSLQSVIVKPAHDERICLSGEGCLGKTYTVEGYAFNGGGDRVERVELSLDGGKTWRYCFRRFTESPLRHGDKYWAWIFWNLMGMMNNAWYRVRPNVIEDAKTILPVLQFQHPVAPGNEEGGWMTPRHDNGDEGQNVVGNLKTYSLEEIAKHNTKDDAWLILDNKVYDVTSVLSWHPGGANAILAYAGKATVDVTNEYRGIHDNYANGKRDECLIGILSSDGIQAMKQDALRAMKELQRVKAERQGFALQPDLFTRAKLVRREEIDIRGPTGGITYEGHGNFVIEGEDYHFDKINLIAGGSGLTPHWQLIHAILTDNTDQTVISLIDSNRSFEDILMREELQKYSETHADRFKLWHVIGNPPPDQPTFKCSNGRLSQHIMEEHFYPADEGVAAFLCGPPGLIEKAAMPGLEEMGFKDGRTVFGF